MRHDERTDRTGISHGAGKHLVVPDHMVAVGERHRARVHQEPHLDHLAPFAPLGQRGHRMHPHRSPLPRPALDEIQRFGRVDGGRRIGPRDHRGHPARRRRAARRAEPLLVPLPRFTDLHADVDDPRREAFAITVDHLARRPPVPRDDRAILDGQRPHRIGPRLRVDQPGVDEGADGHVCSRIIVSSTSCALRT